MKSMLILTAILAFTTGQAYAGAVDDCINSIAGGKASCEVKAAREDNSGVEQANYEPAQENSAKENTEQEI